MFYAWKSCQLTDIVRALLFPRLSGDTLPAIYSWSLMHPQRFQQIKYPLDQQNRSDIIKSIEYIKFFYICYYLNVINKYNQWTDTLSKDN